jgi:transcriptional regulator with XRE-family HTH domain
MEKDVFERLRAILKEKDFSRKKLAKVAELPLSTVTTNISGVTKQPSYAIIEAVLYQFPDISAEWLIRGMGSKYISDLPSTDHPDTDEVLDLKAEITRLRAELAELREENETLQADNRRLSERTDKLIDILYRDDEPSRKKA